MAIVYEIDTIIINPISSIKEKVREVRWLSTQVYRICSTAMKQMS